MRSSLKIIASVMACQDLDTVVHEVREAPLVYSEMAKIRSVQSCTSGGRRFHRAISMVAMARTDREEIRLQLAIIRKAEK
jgi:hypothetical protein